MLDCDANKRVVAVAIVLSGHLNIGDEFVNATLLTSGSTYELGIFRNRGCAVRLGSVSPWIHSLI